MCGRFANNAKPKDVEKEFKIGRLNPSLFEPRYNIAPTQIIPAVHETDGERIVGALRWGLIPSWAKDEKIGSNLINARAETLAEKPSFKNAYRARAAVSFRRVVFLNGCDLQSRLNDCLTVVY